MRAVAADYVAGAHLNLPAGGVAERGVDGVAALGQAREFGAMLDGAAEFLHAGAQQGFGLALREVQYEAVARAVACQVQVEEVSLTGVPAQAPDAVALVDERVCQPHRVKELERSGVDGDCPVLRGGTLALVDDAGVDPAGE